MRMQKTFRCICIVLSWAFWKAFRPKPPVIALRVIYAKNIPFLFDFRRQRNPRSAEISIAMELKLMPTFCFVVWSFWAFQALRLRPSTPQKTSMEQRPLHGDPLKAIFSEGLLFFVAFFCKLALMVQHTLLHTYKTTLPPITTWSPFFFPRKPAAATLWAVLDCTATHHWHHWTRYNCTGYNSLLCVSSFSSSYLTIAVRQIM